MAKERATHYCGNIYPDSERKDDNEDKEAPVLLEGDDAEDDLLESLSPEEAEAAILTIAMTRLDIEQIEGLIEKLHDLADEKANQSPKSLN